MCFSINEDYWLYFFVVLLIRPTDIVGDLFPFIQSLHSSTDVDRGATDDLEERRKIFDAAVGGIVNAIVSYDMGWSKRGNGRSYNSLNGYGTIIGFLSKKIIDYGARNRKCKRCDCGQNASDHDCRKNHSGSAKAMEADVGAALVNDSSILKEAKLNVRVLIGDEDSSTISAVRMGNPQTIHKLTDANHLKKNFVKALYEVNKNFKEMKNKEVIPHLKKCFAYAVAQNKGDSVGLATSLRNIPEHVFGSHENCGSWCKGPHKIMLKDPQLHVQLSQLFGKYADNARKFSVVASSQTNESFNNIMAHKAPKNRCYSMSESADFRLASSVCTKNDGDIHVVSVQKKLNMLPAKSMESFAALLDDKRKRRAIKAKLPSMKARRNFLAKAKETSRISLERTEGTQYETNCGMTIDVDKPVIPELRHLEVKLPDMSLSPEDCNVIYFDLETSGLSRNSEILQIAAKLNAIKFSIYLTPSKPIDDQASRITGLKFIKGKLYFHGEEVLSVPPRDALQSFEQFINLSSKPCILVAHNASFDSRHLLDCIMKNNMIDNFQMIVGFADSLTILKKLLPERKKESGMFKLTTLARDHLDLQPTQKFHEALFDVEILEKICDIFIQKEHFCSSCKPYKQSVMVEIILPTLKVLKGVVSDAIIKKIASSGIDYELLKTTYGSKGETGIKELLSEKTAGGKPRVTKVSKIVDKVIAYFKIRN